MALDNFVMISRVGLCGFLAPDGHYFEFPYMTHHKYAEPIYQMYSARLGIQWKLQRQSDEKHEEFLSRMGFMMFGSKGPGFDRLSHVRFPGAGARIEADVYISDAQKEFLLQNWDRLDEQQQAYIVELSEAYREDGETIRGPEKQGGGK